MANSDKQSQKKLEQKKKKRKLLVKQASARQTSEHKASGYSKSPAHECLVPERLFETGLGTVIWTRRTSYGSIAVGAFVVDVFCLGVKNALFSVSTEQDYEHKVKPRLIQAHEDQGFQAVHPACARKLVEGAVRYAENLGFSPHRDYQKVKPIFGDVDGQTCPTGFTYGRDSKPLYIRGPNESTLQAKRIVDHLNRICGEGNFDYLIAVDGGTLD